MPSAPPTVRLPAAQTNAQGEPRRVGVELEMLGLDLDELAVLVADQLGLTVAVEGRYQRVLTGDAAGDWIVLLDSDLLKRMVEEEPGDDGLLGDLRDAAEAVAESVVETFAPLEVVSPPLPMRRLDEVEGLIVRLREAGAVGTSDGVGYAFAMQFNPEVPSEDAGVLTRYLQAFVCLYAWLLVRAHVNLTRRLLSVTGAYPTDYMRMIVRPDYRPDLGTLIDDYLAHNPTRNRALDVLPLFLHLDEARVRAVIDDPRVKPRPTFHYRLPNCELHLEGWGIGGAWDDWLEVEALAADPDRLAACCAAYSAFMDKPLKRWFGHWAKEIEEQWLAR